MRLRLERWASPISTLLLVTDEADVLRALWLGERLDKLNRSLRMQYAKYQLTEDRAPDAIKGQLEAYFKGSLGALDAIPVATGGTPFQRDVWRALRTIPLGPHAVKALKEHQARVARKGDDDLVFGNRKGDPMRESKLLTNVLQPAAKAAGLGRVTWHQFRHIHSSLLNDLKVPVKIAQEQLGHGSIATTLGIYTHAIEASHRKAVEEVEERLFGVLLRNAPKSGTAATSAAPVNAHVA